MKLLTKNRICLWTFVESDSARHVFFHSHCFFASLPHPKVVYEKLIVFPSLIRIQTMSDWVKTGLSGRAWDFYFWEKNRPSREEISWSRFALMRLLWWHSGQCVCWVIERLGLESRSCSRKRSLRKFTKVSFSHIVSFAKPFEVSDRNLIQLKSN